MVGSYIVREGHSVHILQLSYRVNTFLVLNRQYTCPMHTCWGRDYESVDHLVREPGLERGRGARQLIDVPVRVLHGLRLGKHGAAGTHRQREGGVRLQEVLDVEHIQVADHAAIEDQDLVADLEICRERVKGMT